MAMSSKIGTTAEQRRCGLPPRIVDRLGRAGARARAPAPAGCRLRTAIQGVRTAGPAFGARTISYQRRTSTGGSVRGCSASVAALVGAFPGSLFDSSQARIDSREKRRLRTRIRCGTRLRSRIAGFRKISFGSPVRANVKSGVRELIKRRPCVAFDGRLYVPVAALQFRRGTVLR